MPWYVQYYSPDGASEARESKSAGAPPTERKTGPAARSSAPETAKPAKPTKPASDEEEEEDDDRINLDDEGDDEDTKAMFAKKKSEIEAIHSRQKAKAGDAKSNLTVDVKPLGSDTDMAAVEKFCRSIQMDGLKWLGGELVEIAFGIKKLRIMCQLTDVLVNPDTVREAVEACEDVQSTDIFAFQMA